MEFIRTLENLKNQEEHEKFYNTLHNTQQNTDQVMKNILLMHRIKHSSLDVCSLIDYIHDHKMYDFTRFVNTFMIHDLIQCKDYALLNIITKYPECNLSLCNLNWCKNENKGNNDCVLNVYRIQRLHRLLHMIHQLV